MVASRQRDKIIGTNVRDFFACNNSLMPDFGAENTTVYERIKIDNGRYVSVLLRNRLDSDSWNVQAEMRASHVLIVSSVFGCPPGVSR